MILCLLFYLESLSIVSLTLLVFISVNVKHFETTVCERCYINKLLLINFVELLLTLSQSDSNNAQTQRNL